MNEEEKRMLLEAHALAKEAHAIVRKHEAEIEKIKNDNQARYTIQEDTLRLVKAIAREMGIATESDEGGG